MLSHSSHSIVRQVAAPPLAPAGGLACPQPSSETAIELASVAPKPVQALACRDDFLQPLDLKTAAQRMITVPLVWS